MIVVDSNILAYIYLPGEFTAAAEDLLRRDLDWAAPMLWRSEFRNILAGCLRRKTLRFDQVLALQQEAQSLLDGLAFELDSEQVQALLRDSDCSAYDCEFAALAIQLDTRLVTMDRKLLRAFPGRAVALVAGQVGGLGG